MRLAMPWNAEGCKFSRTYKRIWDVNGNENPILYTKLYEVEYQYV